MTGLTSRSRALHYSQWRDRVDARNERHEAAPHFVYRAFDSYGHLLYIGCSLNVDKRMGQHRSQSLWHKYAETIAISGPYDGRTLAREIETAAIESEASYFNATKADTRATQANRNTAARMVWERMGYPPPFDRSREYDDEYMDRWCSVSEQWDIAKRETAARLKATTHPYMTNTDRLGRYLAARENAELARTEQAAA